MTKTVLLWDIDGTLLLTGGAGKLAFNRIFARLYGEDDIWQSTSPHGRTDYSLIKEVYQNRFQKPPSKDEIQKIKTAYCQELTLALKELPDFKIMPAVQETLQRFHNNTDYLSGLCTGNFKNSAFQKLKHAGLDHFFTFGGFGCDAECRTELTKKAMERAQQILNAEPKQVFVIGDTVHDVRAGKAAGAKTIAVLTGSTKRDVMQKEKPDMIIEDLRELKQFC